MKRKSPVFQFKPFSKKQRQVLNWWCSASPVKDYDGIIADGAVRSGKTIAMSLSFVLWAMESYNAENFAMCGKTIGSFRRNVLFWLKLMLRSRGFTVEDYRTDNLVVVTRGDVQNYFYIFGGKDERSQDLIQGITLAGLFCDEVALMPESFVNQATARCSVEGSKFWFNCNPANPQHWFKINWIDKRKDKNLLYLHFTMDDNLSLSERVKNRYRTMWSGVFFQRYILGLWVAAEGIIYRQFANDPKIFITDKYPPLQIVAIGLDYGAGRSKTTMKAVGFAHGFKSCYILAERDIQEVYEPDALYKHFHAFYNEVVKKFGKCQYVFGDWGGLGNVLNKGLYVYCKKNAIAVKVEDCKKGTILERIELTQQLMAQRRLFIFPECKNMILAFKEAVWSDKHPDERLDDGTSDIDSLDAFEYALLPFEEYLQKAVTY